jgi:hypothetical protein
LGEIEDIARYPTLRTSIAQSVSKIKIRTLTAAKKAKNDYEIMNKKEVTELEGSEEKVDEADASTMLEKIEISRKSEFNHEIVNEKERENEEVGNKSVQYSSKTDAFFVNLFFGFLISSLEDMIPFNPTIISENVSPNPDSKIALSSSSTTNVSFNLSETLSSTNDSADNTDTMILSIPTILSFPISETYLSDINNNEIDNKRKVNLLIRDMLIRLQG